MNFGGKVHDASDRHKINQLAAFATALHKSKDSLQKNSPDFSGFFCCINQVQNRTMIGASAIILHRMDPARNMLRFYRLDVQRDLFGAWCVIREWGRIGRPGQVRMAFFLASSAL